VGGGGTRAILGGGRGGLQNPGGGGAGTYLGNRPPDRDPVEPPRPKKGCVLGGGGGGSGPHQPQKGGFKKKVPNGAKKKNSFFSGKTRGDQGFRGAGAWLGAKIKNIATVGKFTGGRFFSGGGDLPPEEYSPGGTGLSSSDVFVCVGLYGLYELAPGCSKHPQTFHHKICLWGRGDPFFLGDYFVGHRKKGGQAGKEEEGKAGWDFNPRPRFKGVGGKLWGFQSLRGRTGPGASEHSPNNGGNLGGPGGSGGTRAWGTRGPGWMVFLGLFASFLEKTGFREDLEFNVFWAWGQ